MTEFNLTLKNMPSEEDLTARQAIKLKFVQQESNQLRFYMQELEYSLALYKNIVSTLMEVRPADQSFSDTSETKFPPSTLVKSILSQNQRFKETALKNNLHTKIATSKAECYDNEIIESQTKEETLIKENEKQIFQLLEESETKERIIKDLQTTNLVLEREIEFYVKNKNRVLLLKDQKELLKTKAETVLRILMKLGEEYKILYRDIQSLRTRCIKLSHEYKRANSMLRDPQPEILTEGILDFPNRDVSCDQFWITDDQDLKQVLEQLGVNFKNSEKICYTEGHHSNTSKLEKKQKKLKKKCEEYQIKQQTILEEIQNAERLKKLLLQDQEHLKAAVERKKKTRQKSLSAKSEEENAKRSQRSKSNPLDYMRFSFGDLNNAKKIKLAKPEVLNEVQDAEISLIIPQAAEDLSDFSLLSLFASDFIDS